MDNHIDILPRVTLSPSCVSRLHSSTGSSTGLRSNTSVVLQVPITTSITIKLTLRT